jgi:rod shape-determining protein MreC
MNLNEARNRIRWATFIILVVATLLLLLLDSTGNLDVFFGFVENPVTTLLGWTSSGTDQVSERLTGSQDIQEAEARIDQLQAQVELLQRENEELREGQGEYQQLLELFNRAKDSPELRRLTASVIARDTSPVFRSLIIDKGHDDGVFVGMPVESARGLVGQIYRTTAHSAQVILITDNISSIPGRLVTSRATGIIRGGGLGGVITMDWIDLEAQVQPGEVVLTSGLGGKFPQDLVIGRIIEVERREAELFQQAVLQPAVDFDALEMLFVITDFRTIDTSIFDEPPEGVLTNP